MDHLSRRDSVTGCDMSHAVTAGVGAGLTRDKRGGKRISASHLVTPNHAPLANRPRGRSAAVGLVSLSFEQTEALRKFSKDTERSEAARDADRRLEARQSLASAVGVLAPRHLAVVNLLLIRGRDITRLSQVSGQTVEVLNQLLHEAANALADHYQTREAA